MAEVRAAAEADWPELLRLARAMHAESPRYRRFGFDEGKVRELFDRLLPTGGALVAVKDGQIVGMLAGYVAEGFFSRDLFAGEVVVYVAPEHRGGSVVMRLVKTFEEWARAQGACEIVLGVSTECETERTARLYERLGYRRAAVGLVKGV